jgi:glycosyltransferase involved in cell wall biosynthesis
MVKKNKRAKVTVVMPAYNAAKTVKKTYDDLPKNVVDEAILVDDCSQDNTVEVAKKIGIITFQHKKNRGYGGNQKTCYAHALKRGADIVVMVHPDYQYDATLVGEMIRPILQKRYDIMFGSRIRKRGEALKGGMPGYKYIISRMLTVIENIVLGVNFSEHLSGFRAYSSQVLKTLPLTNFSDDFVFDQQLMISAIEAGFEVGEISVPTRYHDESSSIRGWRGAKFLLGTFYSLKLYIFAKWGVYRAPIFNCKEP